MTSGGYGSYSSRVTVRQYRSWIHAEQDDGTSYYGRCFGNRLQFDVYSGWTFAGTQNGTVTTSNWSSWNREPRRWGRGPWGQPYPAYEVEAAAPSAVAPAPTPGTHASRATFTWTTWYGAGSETWTR
jgi:hypothetical protein